MIELRDIDRDNFFEVIKLNVAENQKNFVASNVFSIAQSKAHPECIPLAAYDGGELVGFCMYCMDIDDKEYWIYRLMVDEKFQHRGYGRRIMELLLARIGEDKTHHIVYISFEPNNAVAKHLYESLGFVPDGRIDDGEVVEVLDMSVAAGEKVKPE